MSSDQIAEIAPGIREVLAGNEGTCATFELVGDPDRWVQFTGGGIVNAAYPHADKPDAFLAKLGSATVQEVAPGEFLTVKLALVEARAIARWIDQYFEQVLGAPASYAIDLRLEQLD